MTEKRSDYRKKQSKQKAKKLFRKFHPAFDNQNETETVDVNPPNTEEQIRRPLEGNGEQHYYEDPNRLTKEEKSLRLKKRLNSAILIVFVLIILVLLALFHL